MTLYDYVIKLARLRQFRACNTHAAMKENLMNLPMLHTLDAEQYGLAAPMPAG